MALLVTLFLVLINIFNNTTNVSPNTEGMTAISSWMLACIFFVFGALMSYAFILYLLLRQKAGKMKMKWEGLNIIYNKNCRIHHPPDVKKRLEELEEIEGWRKMAAIDSIFLYLFPLLFFVFNVFYWPFWTLMPGDDE
ncbi:acetylcholine-gated chloride channel subunit acc-2 [Eurytemora carolleeae]|uniref:acetylcholine-gated chloride channel subunit acc-2 n=1 Tax=Eurytemora carolleeae TaxID=1294199 RepID=UPI000C755BC7|nr:acetylcholine-gated chloride channel subunit acc-2 [Eurytemora carolleeae]|eukprot:XP_023338671.1 acetylcholine-gated chloride channel subunit acc-2-like [Eurytemora affinis]